MSKVIEVGISAQVATVTLSRPGKGNAINRDMFAALSAAGRELAADSSLRAVILCGAGEHFCSGIDTSVFADGGDLARQLQPLADTPANLFQDVACTWRDLPVPVIAAVHGAVFGGGLQIAMGADLRIAAPTTRCSVMEIHWGIIPDMGITATMRHVVRQDHLRELVYSGRIVEADEARGIGLLTEVHADPLARAGEIAKCIASRSPDAVRAAKALLADGFDRPLAESLRREAELQAALLGGANQQEAVISKMEKREPRFRDAVEPDNAG